MELAVDVYYWGHRARAVGVLFEWTSGVALGTETVELNDVADYVPGEFFRRELPCVMAIIDRLPLETLDAVASVVVDGHVYVDDEGSPGLGAHVWHVLHGRGYNVAVVGVAKTAFRGNNTTVIPVLRGAGNRPLLVSAIGAEVEEVAERVRCMHGPFRMPTILKLVDALTRSGPV